LLYHLPAGDGAKLLQELRRACRGILLLDTFISLFGREETTAQGQTVRGHYYHEHDPGAATADKLWASLDNQQSFWFTQPSLMNVLVGAGFTSVMEVHVPTAIENGADRKTYLAIAGEPVKILSSDATASSPMSPIPEGPDKRMDGSQRPKGAVHRAAKTLLPQSLKNLIKPALRLVRVLPPDPTPEFMKTGRR
jgi:hypothetical protein